MSGNNIDFDNLTQDQSDKIAQTVKLVTEYYGDRKATNESIKETLDTLAEEFEADKESAARLKKTIKKAASVISANKIGDMVNDNSAVELLLKKMGII